MQRFFTAAIILAAQLAAISGASPVVEDASFTSDGNSVILQFLSDTNRGGYSTSFVCSELLNFDNVATATCQWSDDSTITIFPGSLGTIIVSDALSNYVLSLHEIGTQHLTLKNTPGLLYVEVFFILPRPT